MKNIQAAFFAFIISAIGICTPVYSQEGTEIKINEQQELQERLNELKKQGIEIHYRKETIIKEGVKDERGYLKHLLSELESALKKGKNTAKINRVEGNLVEIDKGAIHKVIDRDVYVVRDSSGKYKGKVEIGAIADAVSIGESYEVDNCNLLESNDNAFFKGNRKLMEIGVWGGSSAFDTNRRYQGLGLNFQYNLRGGNSWEFLLVQLNCNRSMSEDSIQRDSSSQITCPFGFKKYFNYPGKVALHIGIGGSLFKGNYEYANGLYYVSSVRKGIIPYISTGVKFFASSSANIELGIKYFHGPDVDLKGKYFLERPVLANLLVAMAW
ncbi:hypothetical protein KJ633_04090 [bacterium]|nr:hypothetical protein [bacterium]MBU3955619.1 hypothetical protein [bacterium]